MRNPLGIVVLVIGVLLVVFGLNANDSFGSGVSKMFTGAPTDKAIWLLIGGILAIGIGIVMAVRGGSNPR